MSVYAVSQDIWLLNEEADRRFRRAVVALGLPVLLFALIVPLLDIAGLKRGGGDEDGTTRYVELLSEEAAPLEEVAEEPAPAEEDVAEPEPEPEAEEQPEVAEPTPEPPAPEPQVIERTERAREVASQSGVLAFADQLKDLRNPSLAGMDASQPLSAGTLTRKNSSSSSSGGTPNIAASAAQSSGGVATSQISRTQSGTGIGTRRTTTVETPKGFGEDRKEVGQSGDKLIAGRTMEELQIVFDRNKGSFYTLYNRALRSNPGLAGTVNVSLTIDPSGRVTACDVVSSTLNDPDLERKIVARIKLINFGAKAVPAQTFPSYPLHFFPAN